MNLLFKEERAAVIRSVFRQVQIIWRIYEPYN